MTNPFRWWHDWWDGLDVVEQTIVICLFVAACVLLLATPAAANENLQPSLNAVWIALIAAVPLALTGPLIAFMAERSRRIDRREDMEERKSVADRAEKKAEENARLLTANVDNTAKVAAAAEDTNVKLVEVVKITNVIHTLVNSQLTASKQAEYNAIERELALLHEVGGTHPSQRIADAIKTAEASLADLKIVLADRKIATAEAARQ